MGDLNLSAWVKRIMQIETPHEQHILRGIKAYEDEIERLRACLDRRTRQALDMCEIASSNVDNLIESRAETDKAEAEIERLREALKWYGEQSRLCRLIHSEGDTGRHNLADDGGKRARAALQENL